MADHFFGVTNTGRVRDNNEDTFLAEQLSNGWIAACVIDGVGGYEGGEVAAEIARTTIQQNLQQLSADPLQNLLEGLYKANEAIYTEKQSGRGNFQMACVLTIALVDIANNQFYYAHVGDTRLYLLRDQSLVKVTKDHSFVGFLEDSGRLSEREAMQHPKRNEINKALGFDPQINLKADYIETGSSPFLPGDMLLLCSDGLTDLVNRNEMTSVLLSPHSLQKKGETLIDVANIAGGKDNITVVIVQNHKAPAVPNATKPAPVKKNESSNKAATVAGVKESSMPVKKEEPARSTPVAVWILSLLSLLLAGACSWLWFRNRPAVDALPQSATAYTPNEKEKQLTDSLGLATGLLTINDSGSAASIVLGDTVFVRQDTLHINGNGTVLQSDSLYGGPALVATTNNKFLLLENITFKDFPTAILLQGRSIQLKNVRFQNCGIPVQHYLFLPEDSSLNGTIRDTLLLTNSLPK